MSKNRVVYLLGNTDLTDKKRNSVKHKNLLSHIKNE